MNSLICRAKNKTVKFFNDFKNMSIRQWVYRILCFIAIVNGCIALINNIFFGYSTNLNTVIAIATIIISLYMCYVYRHNFGLFLVMVFIAYANYSICMMYLDPSLQHEALHGQFSIRAFSEALVCVCVFEVCLLLFSGKVVANPKSIDSRKDTSIKFETNYIVAFGAMALYLLVFFLTFDFSANGARASGSALAEYRAILVIIGCYYSGKKISMKILWTVIVGVTSIMVFIGGNRIDAFASLLAVIFFWYSGFLTYKKILVCLPFFVIAMMGVGIARGGALNSEVFLSAINNLWSSKFTWDTPMFAYMPSLAIVEITPTVEIWVKLKMLGENFLYIFVGSLIDTSSNLIYYTRESYLHYYGCITPVYFYFWFGYGGAFLFTGLVLLYKKFYQSAIQAKQLGSFKEKIKYIISVYFICNVARWYCYGPNALIRNMFVMTVAFSIVYVFDRIVNKYKVGVIK